MLGLRKKREENVSKIVDLRTLPKVPRDPRMLANNGGVPLGKNKASGKVAPSSLMWTAGSKTKLTDGKSVLTRARREAKEISAMSKLSKPTHQLGGRIGQVARAPVAMLKEYKTASQPQAVKILSRKRSSIPSNNLGYKNGPNADLEEREERLRQAMKSKMSGGVGFKRDADGAVKETLVGSSDDEGEDESGANSLDDLFDETSSRTQSRPVFAAPPTRAPRPTPFKPASAAKPSSSRPHSNSPAPSYLKPSPTSKKPSDLISSIVGKPKPTPSASSKSTPRTTPLATTMSLHRSSPASSPPPKPRNDSPESGALRRPMMPPKKKEVDIFNRRPKKPRVA
jgi:elongin-A